MPVRLPLDGKIKVQGAEVELLEHPAYAGMQGRAGVAIVDFTDKGSGRYGRVVATFPLAPQGPPTAELAAEVLAALPAPPAEPQKAEGVRPPPTLFTAFANVVGIPALSVPCGFTDDGLPIGMQILGGHWAEAKVLRAGHAYESATEWHQRKPPVAA